MRIEAQLGMRIVYLRKKKGMSQEDLALEANINTNYLSDLENGRRNPTLRILEKIATALHIDVSELLKGCKSF